MRKLAISLFASVAFFSATADASLLRHEINRANTTGSFESKLFVLSRCAAVHYSLAALAPPESPLAKEYESVGQNWGMATLIATRERYGVSAEQAMQVLVLPMLENHMADYVAMMNTAYDNGRPRTTPAIVDDVVACLEAIQD